MTAVYTCEWSVCDEHFGTIVELERHVRRHVEGLFADRPSPAYIDAIGEGKLRRDVDSSVPQPLAVGSSRGVRSTLAAPPSKRSSSDMESRAEAQSSSGGASETDDDEDEEEDDDDTVCMVCENGDERPNDRIVLCDTCDSPYHQSCHDPVIPARVVNNTSAPWSCSACPPRQRR